MDAAVTVIELDSNNLTKSGTLIPAADFRAGANSIIVGIAGNASMRTGQLVRVDDLIHF